MSVSESQDQTLLAAFQKGDQQAFDALFRTWYAPLCRYAARLLDGDMDDAEDVVQQTFIKLWEQRETLPIQFSVKAYLYKMVHNRSLNRLRDAQTRRRHSEISVSFGNDMAPPVEVSDLQTRLHAALEQLPTECRRIFELSRFEELKYREIADQLNISIKTVETQMGKALRLMRVQLAEYLSLILCLLWINKLP